MFRSERLRFVMSKQKDPNLVAGACRRQTWVKPKRSSKALDTCCHSSATTACADVKPPEDKGVGKINELHSTYTGKKEENNQVASVRRRSDWGHPDCSHTVRETEDRSSGLMQHTGSNQPEDKVD